MAYADLSEEQKIKRRASTHAWQKGNPERAAQWKLQGSRNLRRTHLELLGGRCSRCGFDDWRALQIDHVNGDGRKDEARNGNRYAYMKKIAANPDKYQLLCANCNWIKRYENNEHGAD